MENVSKLLKEKFNRLKKFLIYVGSFNPRKDEIAYVLLVKFTFNLAYYR